MTTKAKTSPWRFTADEQPPYGKIVVIQRHDGFTATALLRIHKGHKTPTWKGPNGTMTLNDVKAWFEIPKL
jgi:hypothetical protein